ncbi:hypothetical protein JHK85_014317 [Glycine max]|nr:hypothetical protein JHK85_014317 [Glycine max]
MLAGASTNKWRQCGFSLLKPNLGTRIRNRSRKKLFGIGQKTFCVEAANANYEFDPDLRSVIELATDSELYEIEAILFGPSYSSPLLKSIPLALFRNTNENGGLDRSMIGVDLRLRQQFIAALEEQESGNYPALFDVVRTSSQGQATLQHELSQWKVQSKVGAQDIPSIVLKGGGVFTLSKIYQLLARKLSGKALVEAANCQGGQLAMINLESTAALLAAKQVDFLKP